MRLFCLIFCFLLSAIANAENFTWNGVFTQGLFHTDKNNMYGKSEDDISLDYSEFSLNGSYNLPKNFRLSGQGIYRHAGAGFDGVELDYLFLDSQFMNTDSLTGGLRVGRVKSATGQYNEARDIAFTRPSIYLSQSIYQDLTLRNTMLGGDGITFYSYYLSQYGQWNFEFNYGLPLKDNLENINIVGADVDLEIDDALSYKFQYITTDGQFAVSFSGLWGDSISATSTLNVNALVPSLPFTVPPLDIKTELPTRINILTMSYSGMQWTSVFEFRHTDYKPGTPTIQANATTLALLPANLSLLIPTTEDFTAHAYYLQIQRQLSQHFEVFARYDVLISDTDDSNGAAFAAAGRGVSYSRFARDSGIGLRWLPRTNMLVNVEYHYIDGTGWLNSTDNKGSLSQTQRYWNAVAASFSYRF